jgi:hypothetical protein
MLGASVVLAQALAAFVQRLSPVLLASAAGDELLGTTNHWG